MKRREFLTHTASLAGVLATSVPRADARPCPPPLEGGVPSCDAGGAPSWFLNAPNERWFEVPASNTGRQVGMTGGMFSNFAGAAVDQQKKEFIKPCCGGHTVDWRNGVYILKLDQEIPAWEVLVEDTLVQDGNDRRNSGDDSYADGTPRAVHNWNMGFWAQDDAVWLLCSTGKYESGSQGTQMYKLDRTTITDPPVTAAFAGTNSWTYEGLALPNVALGESAGRNYETGFGARDPETGLIWIAAQWADDNNGKDAFYSVDISSGSPIVNRYTYGGRFPFTGDRARRGSCFFVGDYWVVIGPDFNTATGAIYVIDKNNPTIANATPARTTGSWNWDLVRGAGCVYVASERRAYFYRGEAGRTIQTLDVPADPFNGTYTLGNFTPAGDTPTYPGGGKAAQYTNFNLIEDMGNGQSAFIYVGDDLSAPFMYKIPTNSFL